MLAVLLFQDTGRIEGIKFDTKEELFEHILMNHGPDCRLKKGLWLGGCGSPDDGLGAIVGFDSDDEFNREYQQFIEDRFCYVS